MAERWTECFVKQMRCLDGSQSVHFHVKYRWWVYSPAQVGALGENDRTSHRAWQLSFLAFSGRAEYVQGSPHEPCILRMWLVTVFLTAYAHRLHEHTLFLYKINYADASYWKLFFPQQSQRASLHTVAELQCWYCADVWLLACRFYLTLTVHQSLFDSCMFYVCEPQRFFTNSQHTWATETSESEGSTSGILELQIHELTSANISLYLHLATKLCTDRSVDLKVPKLLIKYS